MRNEGCSYEGRENWSGSLKEEGEGDWDGWFLFVFFFLHKGKITTVFMLVRKIQYKAGWVGGVAEIDERQEEREWAGQCA